MTCASGSDYNMFEPRDYIGKSKWTLPTPCLLLDATSFQRSLDEMHAHVKRAGKHVRPHTKSHKCVTIAKKQIEAGAVGICVAKVSEALVFAKAGVTGTLITSPVTTPHGLCTLHTILTTYDPDIRVVCDSWANVAQLCTLMEQIQAKQGADKITRLGVLVDMDGGQGRTGALPDDVIPLVQTIYTKHAKHLDFQGIQCYLGHIQHISSFAERREASLKGMARASEIVRQLRAQQIPCQIVTGGGTGTSDIDIEVPELTDLQVGSYCLLDSEYLDIASRTDPTQFTKSRPTLTLLSSIISANHAPKHVTCDAGLKAMYKDGGTPKIIYPAPNVLPLTYNWFGDEHGAISVNKYKDGETLSDIQASCLKVGNVIEMIVSHCDPTVNLHDYFFVTRDDEVIDVWPIDARGKAQ